MEWILFIFKKGNKYYLVNGVSEEDAWNQLQKKLSWNIKIVKERCVLIKIMNANSDPVSLN